MNFTVGTCQLTDVQGDSETAMAEIERCASFADNNKIDLLCFPECYLQGYTRDDVLARERAFDLQDKGLTRMLNQLRSIRCTLVLGIIEIAGNELYNTAIIVQQGKLVGHYRKHHPNERIFRAGKAVPVFPLKHKTFGVNICNDANYPETAQAVADQGAGILCYPLNNRLPVDVAERWRSRHIENLKQRAQQTGCWIISSDVIQQDEQTIGYGCSAIVSPKGVVVGRIPELEKKIISWRID